MRPWAWLPWGLLALGALLRVVEVEGVGLLPLWPWTRIEATFTHSVTGRPVRLSFYPLFRFQAFRAETDPETEGYYTGGAYPWNQALSRERRRHLVYCSSLGIRLRLGKRVLEAQGGCLSLRLLYPP